MAIGFQYLLIFQCWLYFELFSSKVISVANLSTNHSNRSGHALDLPDLRMRERLSPQFCFAHDLNGRKRNHNENPFKFTAFSAKTRIKKEKKIEANRGKLHSVIVTMITAERAREQQHNVDLWKSMSATTSWRIHHF